MNKYFQFILIVSVYVSVLVSCSKDPGGGNGSIDCSNNTSKSFAANVNPIIQSFCNIPSCHASGSPNGPGPLTNYLQISSASTSIRASIISGSMPKNSSLTTAQKNSIVCWIDSGAPNN